ncbi:MAG: hypothetical protein ABIO55_03675 [Ginsengibacter sp.]
MNHLTAKYIILMGAIIIVSGIILYFLMMPLNGPAGCLVMCV